MIGVILPAIGNYSCFLFRPPVNVIDFDIIPDSGFGNAVFLCIILNRQGRLVCNPACTHYRFFSVSSSSCVVMAPLNLGVLNTI